MPTKKSKKPAKTVKKADAAVKAKRETALKEKPAESKTSEKYFFAVGKRKTSIAQVRIYQSKKENSGIVVNGREISSYFPIARLRDLIESPLSGSGGADNFHVSAKVSGGGMSGQAEAMRLGIARALVKMDKNLKKSLKDLGFLTRDSRIVERKKAGLKKARRAPQWAKR